MSNASTPYHHPSSVPPSPSSPPPLHLTSYPGFASNVPSSAISELRARELAKHTTPPPRQRTGSVGSSSMMTAASHFTPSITSTYDEPSSSTTAPSTIDPSKLWSHLIKVAEVPDGGSYDNMRLSYDKFLEVVRWMDPLGAVAAATHSGNSSFYGHSVLSPQTFAQFPRDENNTINAQDFFLHVTKKILSNDLRMASASSKQPQYQQQHEQRRSASSSPRLGPTPAAAATNNSSYLSARAPTTTATRSPSPAVGEYMFESTRKHFEYSSESLRRQRSGPTDFFSSRQQQQNSAIPRSQDVVHSDLKAYQASRQLEVMQASHDRTKNDLSKVRKQLVEAERSRENAVRDLHHKLDEEQRRHDDETNRYHREMCALRQEISELRMRCSDDLHYNGASDLAQIASSTIDKYNRQIKELTTEVERLQEANKLLENTNSILRDTNGNLESRLKFAVESHERTQHEAEMLRKLASSVQEQQTTLSSTLHHQQNVLRQLEAENESFREKEKNSKLEDYKSKCLMPTHATVSVACGRDEGDELHDIDSSEFGECFVSPDRSLRGPLDRSTTPTACIISVDGTGVSPARQSPPRNISPGRLNSSAVDDDVVSTSSVGAMRDRLEALQHDFDTVTTLQRDQISQYKQQVMELFNERCELQSQLADLQGSFTPSRHGASTPPPPPPQRARPDGDDDEPETILEQSLIIERQLARIQELEDIIASERISREAELSVSHAAHSSAAPENMELLNELRTALEQNKHRTRDLSEEVETLSNKLFEAEKERDQWKQSYEVQRDTVAERESRTKKDIERALADATAPIASVQAELEEALRVNDELRHVEEQRQKEMELLEARAKDAEGQLETEQRRLVSMQESNHEVKRELATALERVDDLKQSVARLTQELESARAAKSTTEEISELQKHVDVLQSELDAALTEKRDLRAALSSCKNDLEAAREAQVQASEQHQRQLQSYKESEDNLKSETHRLRSESDVRNEELQQTRADLAESHQALKNIRATNTELLASRDHMRREIQDHTDAVEARNKTVAALQTQLSDANAEQRAQSERLASQQKELADLRKKLTDALERNKQLLSMCEQQSESVAAAERMLEIESTQTKEERQDAVRDGLIRVQHLLKDDPSAVRSIARAYAELLEIDHIREELTLLQNLNLDVNRQSQELVLNHSIVTKAKDSAIERAAELQTLLDASRTTIAEQSTRLQRLEEQNRNLEAICDDMTRKEVEALTSQLHQLTREEEEEQHQHQRNSNKTAPVLGQGGHPTTNQTPQSIERSPPPVETTPPPAQSADKRKATVVDPNAHVEQAHTTSPQPTMKSPLTGTAKASAEVKSPPVLPRGGSASSISRTPPILHRSKTTAALKAPSVTSTPGGVRPSASFRQTPPTGQKSVTTTPRTTPGTTPRGGSTSTARQSSTPQSQQQPPQQQQQNNPFMGIPSSMPSSAPPPKVTRVVFGGGASPR